MKLPLSLAIFTALAGTLVAPHSASAQTKNKYVTILYATWAENWMGASQLHSGQPWVQTECPPWGGYSIFHWWGRPAYASGDILQYHFTVNGDPAVPNKPLIDKHAQDLQSAGVDFITIDASNGTQAPIMNAAKALCARYKERLSLSLPIPKVAFFVDNATTANYIYTNFYSGTYGNIFFKLGGKPLLMVHNVDSSAVFNNFTVRSMWGLLNANASTEWSFKENTPINGTPAPNYVTSGWPEERSVCAACQATTMTEPTGRQGRQSGNYFNWHWSLVSKNSPTFVFVASWNEWGSQNVNQTNPQSPIFTDCYLTEYSADLEQMTAGHGTQYYDLLKTKVAAYKRDVPNFALRDATTGRWYLKYYYSDGSLDTSNFSAIFDWVSGTNYQSFVGDMNNDGFNDIGVRDTTTGIWHFAQRSTTSVNFANNNNFTWASGANYQPLTGDFDGDGHTDIVMRDSSTGTWYFRKAGTTAYTYPTQYTFTWTAGAGYEPLVGDFNHDGRLDIALRNVATGEIQFATQNATAFTFTVQSASFTWAAGTNYQAFSGDFDRDGYGDVALRQKDNGNLFLANGNGTLSQFFNNDNVPFTAGTSYTAHAFSGK